MPEPPRKVNLPDPGGAESGGRAGLRRKQFEQERGLDEPAPAPPESAPEEPAEPRKDTPAPEQGG